MDHSRVPAPPSQPLHYFDLPITLKWNPGGNQQPLRHLRSPPRRRPKTTFPASLLQTLSSGSVSSPPPPPPPRRRSPVPVNSQTKPAPIRGESSSSKPLTSQERKKNSPVIGGGEPNQKLSRGRDFPSDEVSKKNAESANLITNRRNFSFEAIRNGAARSSASAQKAAAAAEKVDEKKKSKGKQSADADDDGGFKRSKILIKIPNKTDNNKTPPPPPPKEQQNPPKDPAKTAVQLKDQGKTATIINNSNSDNEVVDDETKIWNLRPRKITTKKSSRPPQRKADESPPLKNEGNCSGGAAADVGGEKKKEVKKKPIITIALTKREIEEDIYALTGAKPARRPRRRPKNVQKQLDMVSPGLLLVDS